MLKLSADGMRDYEVTSDDVLWLKRAVQAEGPPHEGVARALVNGFCWSRSRRRYPGSLVSWVRSYAQPCNPRWYLNGDLFLLSIKGRTLAECATSKATARLREERHSRRGDFTAIVVGAVRTALASGRWVSDITDYAAAWVHEVPKHYVARTEPKKGENRFWTREPGWTGYVVRETDDAPNVA